MKTEHLPVGVSLKEAADVLGIDVSTLRRDIAAGCPTVELGSVGRGKGSRVDVDAVRRWRAGTRGDVLPLLETTLMAVFRDGVHERLKIHPGAVAYVLLRVYERAHERVWSDPLVDLPAEMMRLCTICLEWLESEEFYMEGKE
ncbi:MAG TPA: helix-turn-helix domain-containing protein [Nitrospira sp.]|nr:helix-turn-helix domain-containing protein [Nitrospira sp.]